MNDYLTNFKKWFYNKYFETDLGYVIQGDFFTTVEKIPENSIDFNMSDIPYGTTRCRWESVWDLDEMWKHFDRIHKPNTAVVMTAQTPFDKVLGLSNINNLRYEWIWEKNKATGHLNAKKMPMKAHENALVFYNKLPTYNPQKTYGHERKVSKAEHKINCVESDVYNKGQILTTYDSTERYPRSVLQIPVMNNDDSNKFHPTQKPLELYEYFLKTYTNEGDLVIDISAGALTMAVAAEKLNRRWIVVEKDYDDEGNCLDFCRRGVLYFKNIIYGENNIIIRKDDNIG